MSERRPALSRGSRVVRESVRIAFGSIAGNRLRSFLTALGIVIGVLTVVAMVALVNGFRGAIVADMTSFGATLVQFQKFEPRFNNNRVQREQERLRRDLTLEDALAIKRLAPSIAAVSPERYIFNFNEPVAVKAEGKEANAAVVVGVYPDYMMANNHFVSDGRFVTDADVRHATSIAVIGQDVVKALFDKRDALGRGIDVGGRRYTVVGVFEKKGSFGDGSNDNFVMIPLSTFDHQFPFVARDGGDTIHIATIPRSPELVDAAIDEGTAILRARRGLKPAEPNDFAIYTPDRLLAQMSGILNGISFVMIFIAAVALLVGGVGVMNIMLVAVTERTREIGTRMALGARRRDIVLQFLIESSALSGLGGAIGVALALGVVGLVRALDLLPAMAELWAVALGLGVSVSIGVFFGLYPAIKASRLDPIEALRYE